MRSDDPQQGELQIRFWGVRGSIPASGPQTAGFGGNTPCVEVVTPDAAAAIVLDAGSGIRVFGADLVQRPRRPDAVHVFFSHFHWDHLQGLPFFEPLFAPGTSLWLHAAADVDHLRRTLVTQMSAPFHPVRLDQVPSRLQFCSLAPAGTTVGNLTITPFPLHHPQGCSGFRLVAGGRVAVYATDTELGHPEYDAVLRDRSAGAHLLICDAQYTLEERAARSGWGHSSWREAADLANRAGVGELVLFHHDPARSDAELGAIVERARVRFPATRAAREGDVIVV